MMIRLLALVNRTEHIGWGGIDTPLHSVRLTVMERVSEGKWGLLAAYSVLRTPYLQTPAYRYYGGVAFTYVCLGAEPTTGRQSWHALLPGVDVSRGWVRQSAL